MRAICVFCGSSVGRNPEYSRHARLLGGEMARRGYSLVYGGGGTGLMGVLADEVLRDGGEVIGVIPESMVEASLEHQQLSELRVVRTMHERKTLMGSLAQAFIAMPGGMGTFEELLETLTWVQLGIHQKPVGLLNVEGYFGPLLELLDRAVAEEFLNPLHRRALLVADSAGALVDRLEAYKPPEAPASRLRWDEV